MKQVIEGVRMELLGQSTISRCPTLWIAFERKQIPQVQGDCGEIQKQAVGFLNFESGSPSTFGILPRSRRDLGLHVVADFVEVPWTKVVSVHTNIHRKRSIEVSQSVVSVPVQVPGTVTGVISHMNGVVAQRDSLAINGDLG